MHYAQWLERAIALLCGLCKIEQKGATDSAVQINMDFLGIDLSKVPTQSLNDFRVYIIPALYVASSFVSIRLTTSMRNKGKKKKEDTEVSEEEPNQLEAMQQMNKTMSWFMPIMSISIAIVAPLGLALYWLVNNVMMIIERLILNHIDSKKEEQDA